MNKLIIDADSTMFDSISAYTKVYNLLYKNVEGFKPADPTEVKIYSLRDECPLVLNPLDIFNMKLFFEFLEPFPDAVEVIETLSKQFDIYVVSVCQIENAYHKSQYIRDHFKGIKQFVPLISFDGKCEMSKGDIVNSDFSICIDDHCGNLESFTDNNTKGRGNVPTNFNIIYGQSYIWNENNPRSYHRCLNWLEVYSYITRLTRGTNGIAQEIEKHNIIAKFKNDIVVIK